MSVTTEASSIEYTGNGATTEFAVPFPFLAQAHLTVRLTPDGEAEQVLTLGVDYTVTGEGEPAGGTVTLGTAPAAAASLVIERDTPPTQEVDFQAAGAFDPEQHEAGFDRSAMVAQELTRRVETLEAAGVLGDTQIGDGLAVNANTLRVVAGTGIVVDGNGVRLDESTGTLLSPADKASLDALVLRDAATIRVEDYGAVGDGTTDDRAAFVAAIAAAATSKATVYLMAKTYKISKPIYVLHHLHMVGVPTVNSQASTLKAGTANQLALLVLSVGAKIENVSFDGNKLAINCVRFEGLNGGTFINCGFNKAKQDSCYLAGETDGGLIWTNTTLYTAGQRVCVNGNVYECIKTGTSAGSGGPTGTGNAITDNTAIWKYLEPAWAPLTGYTVGDTRQNGTRYYECITAGTSGASGGPTGTGSSITDGQAVWKHLFTANTYCNNNRNTFNGCGFQHSGWAWVSTALDASLTGTYWLSSSRTVVAATAAVTSGSGTITVTGLDLLALNLRAGDLIRVGSGGTLRTRMISAPPSASDTLTVDVNLDITNAAIDFAIMSGDGYHEEPHSDNNIATIRGGLIRNNCGVGLAFAGLYGPSVYDVQFDFNTYALRGGLVGGSPVHSGLIAHCYTEAHQSGKAFLFKGVSNWNVIAPLDLGGTPSTNVDYDSSTAVFLYQNVTGLHAVGGSVRNLLATTNIGAVWGEGATWSGPIKLASGISTVTGTTLDRDNSSAAGNAFVNVDAQAGDKTVTVITPNGAGATEILIVGCYSTLHKVTFQNSANLILRSTADFVIDSTVNPRDKICFYYAGSNKFVELFRCTQGEQVFAGPVTSEATVKHVTGLVCTSLGDSSASPGNATLNNAAGKSAIANGATQVTITSDKVGADSKVAIDFAEDPGARYWRTVTGGSFTVFLSAAAGSDLTFDWAVVG